MNRIQRRAHLGLAIQGPFSRNHRRTRLINAFPYLLSISLRTAAIAFILFFIF